MWPCRVPPGWGCRVGGEGKTSSNGRGQSSCPQVACSLSPGGCTQATVHQYPSLQREAWYWRPQPPSFPQTAHSLQPFTPAWPIPATIKIQTGLGFHQTRKKKTLLSKDTSALTGPSRGQQLGTPYSQHCLGSEASNTTSQIFSELSPPCPQEHCSPSDSLQP